MSATEEITDNELMSMLEDNGFPSAAEAIASGKDRKEATAYIVGRKPIYDDGEGRWLHDYIERLHS